MNVVYRGVDGRMLRQNRQENPPRVGDFVVLADKVAGDKTYEAAVVVWTIPDARASIKNVTVNVTIREVT